MERRILAKHGPVHQVVWSCVQSLLAKNSPEQKKKKSRNDFLCNPAVSLRDNSRGKGKCVDFHMTVKMC